MSPMASQITSFTIVYSKKTSKICVTGLCVGNSPVTGEFPAQRSSIAENVSIWWCYTQLPLTKLQAYLETNIGSTYLFLENVPY